MHIHTHILDSIFAVKYMDILDVVNDVCTNLDSIFYDSVDDESAESVEIGEVIFEKLVQVGSKLKLPIYLAEVQSGFSITESLLTEPVKPLLDISAVMPSHSEILDAIFVVDQIEMHDSSYSDFNALISDKMLDDMMDDSDFSLNEAALFDSSLMNIDFDFFVLADMTNIVTHPFKGSCRDIQPWGRQKMVLTLPKKHGSSKINNCDGCSKMICNLTAANKP
ncbi:uncharacterized protein LOC111242102 [Vigna radiata var. radiata]|uniref:Uncharacterized protein LOC111242102 n=1 Tax=Vigna radiata var. radiata TaxID=3916 RepID=A0A3Q0FCI4_VIGRR|nr:uncharacterized protein LOC111242102 [Vigna radiata var. radiata]